MLYLYIYIALFVGTLVYAVWDSHNKVKSASTKTPKVNSGTKETGGYQRGGLWSGQTVDMV